MLRSIVITAIGARHRRIIRIEDHRRIVALMAVMMVLHICIHVCLVVIQINRFRTRVVVRISAISIRRTPCGISRTAEHIPKRRTLYEYRTNDVVIAVQITISYDLYIQRIRSPLRD